MTPFVEAARQLVYGLRVRDGRFEHRGNSLVWRHHGLGMLQAELTETLRIHIWHPSLVSSGMAWPRGVHDHRFDLTSAVVVGSIIDVPCSVMFDERPIPDHEPVNVYEIEHAKNQERSEGGVATRARLLSRGALCELGATTQTAGHEYHIARRAFHTTRVPGFQTAPAITVVHRSHFDDRLARVLCAPDKDVTAISGIVRDNSSEHKARIIHLLHEAAAVISTLGDI